MTYEELLNSIYVQLEDYGVFKAFPDVEEYIQYCYENDLLPSIEVIERMIFSAP